MYSVSYSVSYGACFFSFGYVSSVSYSVSYGAGFFLCFWYYSVMYMYLYLMVHPFHLVSYEVAV